MFILNVWCSSKRNIVILIDQCYRKNTLTFKPFIILLDAYNFLKNPPYVFFLTIYKLVYSVTSPRSTISIITVAEQTLISKYGIFNENDVRVFKWLSANLKEQL